MFNNIKKKLSVDTQEIKKATVIADNAFSLEEIYKKIDSSEIKSRAVELREKYASLKSKGAQREVLAEAIALYRETARRFDSEGRVPYKVQVIGAVIINNGETAEMKTGEGKTLTASLASFLAYVRGYRVHVVTVNEYLVERDAEEFRPVYEALGLSVSFNVQALLPDEKREAYKADVMYSINAELGFDYLRDNMATDVSERVQQPLEFCLIDEADSILIDEARTPLIISGSPVSNIEIYKYVDSFVKSLDKEDFEIDLETNSIILTNTGITKAEQTLAVEELYTDENIGLIQKINQSLNANYMQHKDVDYVVKNDEILIVDKFTGRIMEGRSFSDGLHQAIEAKENVTIREETRTMATITYQNYFKLYKQMAGMTGTAKTEEEEFVEVYNMRVIQIPTNKPVIRKDMQDVIFATEEAKYKYVAQAIKERNATGQPILVGTVSVEHSEYLSKLLKNLGVRHEVLNAKNHKRESEIVKNAGKFGSVTIATNMAGRGTDIKLEPKSREAGGLAVIATERHESRRIDDQLRGRSGRQGDVGYSIFYVSLEDDLMKRYGGERIKAMMKGLFEVEGSIENKAISKSITTAQKRVEASNYDSRKNLLKYDNVLNSQRQVVYDKRNQLLNREDVNNFSEAAIYSAIEYIIKANTIKDNGNFYKIDVKEANKALSEIIWKYELDGKELLNKKGKLENLVQPIYEFAKEVFFSKEELFDDFELVQTRLAMQLLDELWMEHIDAMTHLREGIQLAQYAQKDPLTAYQEEGYDMFEFFIFKFYSKYTEIITKINPART